MVRIEVADADRADTAFGDKLLQRAPGRKSGIEGPRHRPVEEVKVEILEPELSDAGVEGAQSFRIAIVGKEQLGRDEQLGAVDAALANALANLRLVAIGRGGVDQPITGLNCSLYRLNGLIAAAV